jgi:hypothetical protein
VSRLPCIKFISVRAGLQGQPSAHGLAWLGPGLAERVHQLREDDDGHEAAAVKLELEDKVPYL